jgi:hypothetical protein
MQMRLASSSTFFLQKHLLLEETHAMDGRKAKKELLLYYVLTWTVVKFTTSSSGKICQAKVFQECADTAMQIFQ